jgi:hypothetical protein
MAKRLEQTLLEGGNSMVNEYLKRGPGVLAIRTMEIKLTI